MAVKVIIRRRVAGDQTSQMLRYLSVLDQWAMKHSGYFYGEHLENPAQPGEYLSIGTWQSIEAFNSYAQSTPAQQLERLMATRLGMRSNSTVYERPPRRQSVAGASY